METETEDSGIKPGHNKKGNTNNNEDKIDDKNKPRQETKEGIPEGKKASNEQKEDNKIHNPYQKPKQHGENAWKDGKKSVEIVSSGREAKGKNPFFIRIRTQFDMKQTSLGHVAHQIEIKRVMDGFVRVLKKSKKVQI